MAAPATAVLIILRESLIIWGISFRVGGTGCGQAESAQAATQRLKREKRRCVPLLGVFGVAVTDDRRLVASAHLDCVVGVALDGLDGVVAVVLDDEPDMV